MKISRKDAQELKKLADDLEESINRDFYVCACGETMHITRLRCCKCWRSAPQGPFTVQQSRWQGWEQRIYDQEFEISRAKDFVRDGGKLPCKKCGQGRCVVWDISGYQHTINVYTVYCEFCHDEEVVDLRERRSRRK